MHTNPEVLALLALGEQAGTPQERQHTADCAVCAAEVEELSSIAHTARQSNPADGLVQPDPRVWSAISAAIRSAEPVGPLAPATAKPDGTGRRGRSARAFVLVAALALIAGMGIGLGIERLRDSEPVVAAPVHLNGLPAWPGSEGEARLEIDAQGQRVLVVSVDPAQPTTGRLEVWVSDDKALKMKSMGVLTNGEGRFVVQPSMDLKEYPVIDVSEEPVNDTDPHHSTNSIVRGRLVR